MVHQPCPIDDSGPIGSRPSHENPDSNEPREVADPLQFHFSGAEVAVESGDSCDTKQNKTVRVLKELLEEPQPVRTHAKKAAQPPRHQSV